MSKMYIEKLTIKNFRCFAQEMMEFHWPGFAKQAGLDGLRLPNVNLLIGNNGTGKTTIFQALTIAALRPYLEDNVSGFRCPTAIRHATEEAESVAALFLSPVDTAPEPDSTLMDVVTTPQIQTSVIKRSRTDTTETSVIKRKGSLQSLEGRGKEKTWTQNLFFEDHPGCFVAAYGAGRRIEPPETYLARDLGVRYRRIVSLFETHIGLMPLSLAYERCQRRGRWNDVVEIVNRLLPSQGPSQVTLTTERDDRGEPLFEYDGIPLPVSELSDGYRLFLGWLVDCLAHLAWVMPAQVNLTDSVGMVIVDEVDLFLAPAWQRTVLESLSATFPLIQWFCSTHSALVAGSLESDNIYILERSAPYTSRVRRPTDEFEGKSVETVLMELFNVQQPRSPELQRQLRDLAERAIDGDIEASIEYLRRLNKGTAMR